MKTRMNTLLSLGGGLLFLGVIGFIAIGDRLSSGVLNAPALGHEAGDAAAWALVSIVLIPLGSVACFIWTLYRRARKPPPAYAEFLEEAYLEEVDLGRGARRR
ncbi:hypothetical protein MAMC_00938 [Methylacidimicrobium cyclopophantes]|uniref:Uncharacterized protein n=1 Tax=Methylacidimicrobium cyclopophantes TaxID=1041766 RepID=A0A5E6MCN0_9BACT|nr:hypothetical protein [Methylacidimicrobium cyclopophantes]VVM06085.1 hypothetical protein MAMC_00938 [Methylacidimicrobium cyclopophantes]